MHFQVWGGGLLLVALFVLISATWLDRPVASWVHDILAAPNSVAWRRSKMPGIMEGAVRLVWRATCGRYGAERRRRAIR
jgi:hypothetical protein